MTANTGKFRAGLIQMRTGRTPQTNLDTAAKLIGEAKSAGADYVQTPEMTNIMEVNRETFFGAIVDEDADTGVAMFRELARSLGIHVHVGSLAIRVSPDKAANRAFLIDPRGEIVARYDKIPMFDVDLASGEIFAFPRLISLKNGAIAVMEGEAKPARFGPLMQATPMGDIRHLVPRPEAVARMSEGAMPALLLFPRFGHEAAVRSVGKSDSFVRLTLASTNYVALGEAGFAALSRFVDEVPAQAFDYGSGEEAMALVEQLWSAAA